MDDLAFNHEQSMQVDDPLRAACRSLVQDLYDNAPFPVSMSADLWPAWEGSPPESWKLRTGPELVEELRSLLAAPYVWP